MSIFTETGGNDNFTGGAGNDTFYSYIGTDILHGAGGDDFFSIQLPPASQVNPNDDQISYVYGGAGDDTLAFYVDSRFDWDMSTSSDGTVTMHASDPLGIYADRTVIAKSIEHIGFVDFN